MTLCMDAEWGRGMAAAARGVLHMVGPWYIGAGVRKPPLVTTPSSSSEGGHRTLATHFGLSRMATDSPAQPTRSTDPSAHHPSSDTIGDTSNPPAQPGVQAVDDLTLVPIETSTRASRGSGSRRSKTYTQGEILRWYDDLLIGYEEEVSQLLDEHQSYQRQLFDEFRHLSARWTQPFSKLQPIHLEVNGLTTLVNNSLVDFKNSWYKSELSNGKQSQRDCAAS